MFTPEYMQVRGIIIVIAAVTFYLLFQGDLKRIVDKLSARGSEPAKQAIYGGRQSALPPAQSLIAATLEPRRTSTAEIVQPPSITEHTTILLDEKKR